jgi:hypothetical protein
MIQQKKLLIFAIIVGIVGIVVGGIIFANTIMDLLYH